MAIHPNKHIRKAISYAEKQGWRIIKAHGQAHMFGVKSFAQCILERVATSISIQHPKIQRHMLVEFIKLWTIVLIVKYYQITNFEKS